ncbi:MAG: hypothetical protein AYK18_17385 [Theionarchaea archaeon DG-70]|nr:MAG: hypothetical protein AYK18_17385 [Theionarchaea archaeon DG-70]
MKEEKYGGYVRITIRDAQTSKNVSIEAEPHHTAGQLIDLVRRGLNLAGNYTLVHRNKALRPHETLGSAGVRDGDTLILISEARGGVYCKRITQRVNGGYYACII